MDPPTILPMTRPQPLAHLPAADAARVVGVMTDIDDTLTAEGRLDPAAADALAALRAAGVPVVAITGRPMGWSEDFVRPGPDAWPVRAIVAERGRCSRSTLALPEVVTAVHPQSLLRHELITRALESPLGRAVSRS